MVYSISHDSYDDKRHHSGMMSRRNGGCLRFLLIMAIMAFFIYGIYLYHDVQTRLKNSEDRAERYRQQHDSISAQLQVVYEHKSRLEKSLQQEKADHKKSKDDLLTEKNELEDKANGEKQELLNRINSINQQHKMLESQHEDLQADHSKLQEQNAKQIEEARQVQDRLTQQALQLRQEKELEIASLKNDKEALQRKHNELYEKLTLAVKAHQDTQAQLVQQQQQQQQLVQQQALQQQQQQQQILQSQPVQPQDINLANQPLGQQDINPANQQAQQDLLQSSNIQVNGNLPLDVAGDTQQQMGAPAIGQNFQPIAEDGQNPQLQGQNQFGNAGQDQLALDTMARGPSIAAEGPVDPQKIDNGGIPADANQFVQNPQVQEPLVGQNNNAPEIQQPEVINLETSNQQQLLQQEAAAAMLQQQQPQIQPAPDMNQQPDLAAAGNQPGAIGPQNEDQVDGGDNNADQQAGDDGQDGVAQDDKNDDNEKKHADQNERYQDEDEDVQDNRHDNH